MNGATGVSIYILVIDTKLFSEVDIDMLKVIIIETSTGGIVYDSQQLEQISTGSIAVYVRN